MSRNTNTKPKRILVIDDELSVTRLLKLRLESTGAYAVRTVNRGSEGFQAAREFEPHAILIDVIMPDRSGLDVAYDIRAEERLKGVPIIFLTAMAWNDQQQTHTQSSARSFSG